MITNTPPATWDTGQSVAPEKLNRNILAAEQQLVGYANNRWRRWSTEYTLDGSAQVALPSITGFPYIVERVSVVGTYSGAPTLYYGPASGLSEFALPPEATSTDYKGTVLPGDLISDTDNTVQYLIGLDGGSTAGLKIIVALRSDRNPGVSTQTLGLTPWKDGDALTASAFNGQVSALNTYADDWITHNTPVAIDEMSFSTISSATSISAREDRVPGDGPVYVQKIIGRIIMDTAGAAGQTVTIAYGLGSASTSFNVSVDGVTTATFTEVVSTINSADRDPTNYLHDLVVRVTNNGASVVEHVTMFVVSTK